jgi:succinyl-CoA synthetase beta subunit
MHLHEYQSKQLIKDRGLPVPEGLVITEAVQLGPTLDQLGGDRWVIKAQVHAGGRGKAGGVKLVNSRDEARTVVSDLLGKPLVTHQTGAEGLPVNTLYIESPSSIAHEYYLGMLIDRSTKRIVIMASAAGGMDIEAVAAETPEKILTEYVNPVTGLMPYQSRNLAFGLGLEGEQIRQFAMILGRLYALFTDSDASLLEINPLISTTDGDLILLDAKFNVDDNALYRQKHLLELRDISQEDAREAQANEHDLNYIHLDGNIGCMVNGAGLAMATMDLIKLEGGDPANFLDVGGGTTAERVAEAFKIILSDPKVSAVLVNIFGGIVRCDLIAEGIIRAVQGEGVEVPVVVRLEGTNVEQGRVMLAESGLNIVASDDLTAAARKAIELAGGVAT